MMTSPTFRYRAVSPNSTRQGDSVAWRGAGYGELMSTSQWDGPWSTTSPMTASPRCGMYRPLSGITLTTPSCSFRMPSCAAKTCPPSLYVPGPGFSPGPPTASPGMTIGRSAPLLCIGVSLSRNASKPRRLLEASGQSAIRNGFASLSNSDALLCLEDSSLDVSFRLRVEALKELGLQAGRHLDDPDPRSGGRPFLLDNCPERLEVPIGLRAVLGAQLHRDPNLLEADRDEGPKGVEDFLHLLLDALERVDVDLRLFHRVLDPLRRMGRRRLGVDRVRGNVLHDLFALRLQHLAALLGRQLNLAALDDLLGDREGLRGPEELHHLLLGRFRALVRILENLVDGELAKEIDLFAVPDPLDRVRLHEDLELLARLLDAGNHIFLEDIVATVRSELFRHDLARLRRRRDPREILTDFGLREPSELLPLDDQADLDRAGVELLAFRGLLEALQSEDHRVVLGHVLLVLLFEEFHDRLATLADTPGLIRHEGAARVRLEQMGPEVVHARDEQRGPERTHAAVLGVVLLVIANPLDEEVDPNLLAVRDLVDLRDEPGIVHEDPRIGHEAGGRRSDVLVNLKDLLNRRRFDEPRSDLLVGHQHDAVLELQAHGGVAPRDRHASVFHLEQAAVWAEDRNRAVVRHLARLHMINLGPLIKRSPIRVPFSFSATAVRAVQVFASCRANRSRCADRRHADAFPADGTDVVQGMDRGVFLEMGRPDEAQRPREVHEPESRRRRPQRVQHLFASEWP